MMLDDEKNVNEEVNETPQNEEVKETGAKDDYLEISAYQGHDRVESDPDFCAFEVDGDFYFAMLDANGNVLLRSEGYSSAKSRDNGIKSVTKNREVEKRYSILNENDQYFVILKAGNHQEIGRSGAYAKLEDATASQNAWKKEETPVVEAKKEAAPAEEVVEAEIEEKEGIVLMQTDEPEEEVVEEVVEEDTPDEIEEETQIVVDRGPHDDFDWSLGKRNTITYNDSDKESLLKDYSASLNSVIENEVVKGRVSDITSGDVVLDINAKSDGLVSLSEFRDMPDLKVGDMVDVYVEQQEDAKGQLILSRRKAKLLTAWESLVESYNEGTIIQGLVVSKTKGGLIVDCNGLETFLPGSQIDIKPIIDYDSYVGKTMDFKVVKINEAIKNAVVSHKALIESDLADQREQIISGLEKGQVLEGLVKNITDFGAFLDLGGVDGLLYITDISWGRISHPREVLELNQKINVVVLDFDENKKRISLGLKQLQPHPWEVLGEDVKEGSVVKGKIVNIEDYGAFLEITPGVEGLIHVSEVTWSNQPVNARDYFKVGQEYDAKIVTIDREDRKMSLSLKQMSKDPWSDIAERYPNESRHSGEVKNLTPYGVFVELEEGIGGMIHISDLSWTKRYAHPSEFTKVGDTIEIMVLDVNPDTRKMSLGHKQLEENPWDTFETVFPVGSFHEATIVRRDDKGAIVLLPYGLEAYAPLRHVKKEDGNYANPDEILMFKVLEFNRDDKRILVSHSRYTEQIQRDADDEVKKERQKEQKKVRNVIKKTQKNIELTTLGDLDVFSDLKSQLQDSDKKEDDKKEDDKKDDK